MYDVYIYIFILLMSIINLCLYCYYKDYCKYNSDVVNSSIFGIVLFITFIHYFINCFSLYGFSFNDKKILLVYITISIIICSLWLFSTTRFKSNCLLSNVTDILCDFPCDDTVHFIEFYRFLGVPDITLFNIESNIAFFAINVFGMTFAILKLIFN